MATFSLYWKSGKNVIATRTPSLAWASLNASTMRRIA
jgi:hypothetical protein